MNYRTPYQTTMEDLRKKHEADIRLEQQQKPQDFSDYNQLYDFVKANPDNAKWQWVEKQEEVVKANVEINTLFVAWLLEKHKVDFAKFVKDSGYPHIKNYCNIAIEKSKEYKTPEDIFKADRDKYESRINDLESKLTDIISNKEKEVLV
ncbi:MAG: hypothetical protein R3Y05_01400 [bacterium]